MATDDAMDVESITQGVYMDVEHQSPTHTSTSTLEPETTDVPNRSDLVEQHHERSPGDLIPPDIEETIRAARTGIVSFLRDRKAEQIVPDNSRVVIVDANIRLNQAFRALLENGVRAAPVIDTASHEFCGMLSVSDILDSLLHMYCTHQAEDPLLNLSNGLSEFTVKTWHDHNRRQLHHENRPVLAQFTYADADGSLLDAVTLMRDMRMLHLPILYRDKTLLHTLEHWRVLNFLHRHFSEATPVALDNTARTDPQQASRLFSLPLSQLRLGTYANLVTIPASTTLLVCLQTLQQQGLSAIPIVNDRNQLIEVYSRGDVAMLVNGRCDGNILQRSVGEVLSGIRGGVSFSGVTCIRTDVLGTVFERFERTGVQRIYIVGENGLEGVVSLSDMLRYFLHGF